MYGSAANGLRPTVDCMSKYPISVPCYVMFARVSQVLAVLSQYCISALLVDQSTVSIIHVYEVVTVTASNV